MSFVRNERFQGNLDNSLDNIKNNIINLKTHRYLLSMYNITFLFSPRLWFIFQFQASNQT